MGIITDIVLAVPIGLIYNSIVHKIGEILNNNAGYEQKIQKNLLIVFIGALFGFLIAYLLFNSERYKNRALRYGLYFGSIILFIHSILYNWPIMQNDTKIIILILTFATLIWYSFSKLENSDEYDDSDEDRNFLPSLYVEKYKNN